MRESTAEQIARTWIEAEVNGNPLRLNKVGAMEYFGVSYGLIKRAVQKAKELAAEQNLYFDYDPRTGVGEKGYFRICPAGENSIADRMNAFQHKLARDEVKGAMRSVIGYRAAGFGTNTAAADAIDALEDAQESIERSAAVLNLTLDD